MRRRLLLTLGLAASYRGSRRYVKVLRRSILALSYDQAALLRATARPDVTPAQRVLLDRLDRRLKEMR